MTSFVVDEVRAGQRLDVVLAAVLDVSRSRAAARIAAGGISVDGEPATKQHRLRVGERVEIGAGDPVGVPPPPELPPIRYRDEHLLVVAKPPGLVVHPGHGHEHDTLVQAMQAAGIPLAPAGGARRPGIVHRLDRDTSGLLVVASTDLAHERLVRALAAREVHRRYLAVVIGEPANRRGRIEAPVGRDPHSRTRFGVVADGKPAVTRYRTLDTCRIPVPDAAVSLVTCTLETGRTHQIRVHLAALGHPVVGDPVYGTRPAVASALGASRPMLHAAELRFAHPVTGVEVAVSEPAPDDMAEVCRRAGLAEPSLRLEEH